MNFREKTFDSSGFTLVEVLTAVAILGLIMMVVGVVFVQVISSQRRGLNAQKVEENLNFVLEAMAREIRVSIFSSNSDTPDCQSGLSSSLSVAHPINGGITYSLSGTNINRNNVSMNSNTVQFTRLGFCIIGTSTVDNRQPRVTIVGTVQGAGNNQLSEDFQTTISQRLLDVP